MASMQTDESNPALHMPMILCCMCGTKIQPNKANMCINCLKGQVDITEGISKQITMFCCRGCGRYQRDTQWVTVALESRELLALCLKKIKGINKDVKLVDAGFVWTEPHSKRIKVKLTIQKEVLNSAILQQVFIVEFIVANMQCLDCQKSYTEHTWNTCVQVRQKVKHKRTFFFLEQLLLKHGVCEKAISVKEMPGGLDFFWGHKNDANHLLAFLKNVVPIQDKSSKRLISQDDKSNTKNYKFTIYVEIAPICKDDLCCLDPKLAQLLGGVSPLMVCHKVSSGLHLIDPVTLKFVEVSGGTYWRYPFRALMSSKQLVEFIVLNVEKADYAAKGEGFNKHNSFRSKLQLAEVTVARSADMGVNDESYECLTHLGNVLKAGDTVLGYDVRNCNLSDTQIKPLKDMQMPDIILIRKTFPNRKNRSKNRQWRLKSLQKESGEKQKKADELRDLQDYEQFMQDIEEDPEMRSHINLYRKSKSRPAPAARAAPAAEAKGMDEEDEEEGGDDGFPTIEETELQMEELKLNFNDSDVPDNTQAINFGASSSSSLSAPNAIDSSSSAAAPNPFNPFTPQ